MEVLLSNGHGMPVIGLGTWQAKPDVVEEAVLTALSLGYRSIDTAYNYGNEEAIGIAIERWISSGGKREDIFITTKLPNFGNRATDVPKYLTDSLSKLRLNYIDLYLVHHPFGFSEPPPGDSPPNIDMSTDHIAIWQAMEKEVENGHARSIGLSNFNESQIRKIHQNAKIPPANLQIELHAYLQQPTLVDACKQLNISVTAYAPLGSPTASVHFRNKYDYNLTSSNPLQDSKVVELSNKLKKTPAQILLRFLIQCSIIVIPKSSSKERIKENFQVFEFTLDEEAMKELRSLDRGENGRIFDFLFYKGIENHPEYPFSIRDRLTQS